MREDNLLGTTVEKVQKNQQSIREEGIIPLCFFKHIFKTFLLLFLPILISSCGNSDRIFNPIKEEKRYLESNFRKQGSYAIVDEQLLTFKQKETINYVALGDSVSQGFFSIPMVSGPGSLDNKGDIVGVSYPTYLVNLINRVQPGKIASFTNLSLAGSTVFNWDHLLDYRSAKYRSYREDTKRKIIFNETIGRNSFFHFSNQIQRNFSVNSKPPYSLVVDKIKNANLITISIGTTTIFNIYFAILREILLLSQDKGSGFENVEKIKKILREYLQIFKKVLEDFKVAGTDLIRRIRMLNPITSIVIISPPYTQFLIYERLINLIWSLKEDAITQILVGMQNTLKDISRENNLSYVSVFSRSWEDSSDERLITTFLDNHPSIDGQRWIARQIFLKIAMPIDVLEEYLVYNKYDQRKDWLRVDDKEYLASDFGEFRKEIYLSPVVEERINWFVDKVSGERSDAELNFAPYSVKTLELPDIINNFLEKLNANSFGKILDLLRVSSFTESLRGELSTGELVTRIISFLKQKYNLISIQPFWREKIADIKLLLGNLFNEISKTITRYNFGKPKIALIHIFLTSLLSPDILLLIKQLFQTVLKDTPPLKVIFSALGSVFN